MNNLLEQLKKVNVKLAKEYTHVDVAGNSIIYQLEPLTLSQIEKIENNKKVQYKHIEFLKQSCRELRDLQGDPEILDLYGASTDVELIEKLFPGTSISAVIDEIMKISGIVAETEKKN